MSKLFFFPANDVYGALRLPVRDDSFLGNSQCTRSERVHVLSSFNVDRSPNKHREGQSGIWQRMIWDNVSVMFLQKW